MPFIERLLQRHTAILRRKIEHGRRSAYDRGARTGLEIIGRDRIRNRRYRCYTGNKYHSGRR